MIVCDAQDSQSDCAQGCIMPSFDENAAEITEEETPDDTEEFEQVSEIKYEMDLTLDYGSTDGKSLEDVANQLKNDFQAVFDKVNPFDDGITTLDVTIEKVVQCVSGKELGLSLEDVSDAEDCDPATDKRRKRKSLSHFVAQDPDAWNKALENHVARMTTTYTGENDATVTMSPTAEELFAERVASAIKDLGNQVEDLSDAQICAHASVSLGASLSYVSKAISNTANLTKMKGVQTTKSQSSQKFHLYNWMSKLPAKLRNIPLSMLAIPGTHQSASYWFQNKTISEGKYPAWLQNGKSPDFLQQTYQESRNYRTVRKFYAKELHLGKYNGDWPTNERPDSEFEYFRQWNRCLRSNTEEQLHLGVRYFDYR